MNVAESADSQVPMIVSTAILVFILLGNLYILPGWWAGTRSVFLGKHHERTLVAAILVISSMLAIGAIATLADNGFIGETLTRILIGVLAAVVVLSAISALSLYWFNQPKFLVPPRLRRERGRWRQNRKG
ncbi:hypothetical protein ACFQFC_11850 [Amorphoplanes digitatis]|uniref:Uncharacterized protein n=1 Tax=Actinoplanes digitatis TaxID=1868 RepID=A0A7W7I270_9ACTN|nr:hypothetical protein [Actinoplanes digitatis]MBB4764896.1 hypothetical protein [Actinoplanes digitatis]GID94013.1 hypothetical protein Adi01nite_34250 [Actinoplanes digitatis]